MMKKTFSRAFSAIVALALVLTAAGCGTRVEEQSVWIEGEDTVQTITHSSGTSSGSSTTNSSSSKKETVSTNSDGITNVETIDKTTDDKFNLKGAKVVIATYRNDDGGEPSPSSSTYQDEIKLISDIEKKYNCKIEYKVTGSSMQHYSAWTAAAQAGSKFCDILQISTAIVLPSQIRAGYLTKLDKYLDTKSVIYNKKAMEQLSYKGDHYVTVMSNRLYDPVGMFFNKKVFKLFGVDTPDKYVAKNKWNWDTFVEVAKATTGTKGGVDYYGFGSSTGNVNVWAIANGSHKIIEKNGKMVLNMGSESYIKAIQHAYDLYNTHKVMGGAWEQGNVAMLIQRPAYGKQYMESLGADAFGFTYIPMGPDVKTYISTVNETTSWGIPATVKNPEVMAKILYDLTYPYKWRKTLEQQQEVNFNDETSLKTAMDVVVRGNDNINLEPLYSYVRNITLSDYGIKSQTSPRAYIESIKGEAQAEIDEIWGQ